MFIVAIVLPANAEPDRIMAGPYTVYLDTNIYLDKIIESYEADLSFRWDYYKKESETLDGKAFTQYSLLSKPISDTYSYINSDYDDYYILIRIIEMSSSERHEEYYPTYNWISLNLTEEAKEAVKEELKEAKCNDIKVYSRIIDDYNGAIGEGLDSTSGDKTYTAIWYMDDITECLVASNIPWDEGTRQLINSIHINLGESYLIDKAASLRMNNRYDEAIQILNKVIEINPQNGEAWFAKGWYLFYDTNKTSDTIKAFDQFIEIAKNSDEVSTDKLVDAWGVKGMAFSQQQKYDEAIQAFDMAIEIDPRDYFAYWQKGETLYVQGYYDDAIQALDKSLELNPDPNPNHNSTLALREEVVALVRSAYPTARSTVWQVAG